MKNKEVRKLVREELMEELVKSIVVDDIEVSTLFNEVLNEAGFFSKFVIEKLTECMKGYLATDLAILIVKVLDEMNKDSAYKKIFAKEIYRILK